MGVYNGCILILTLISIIFSIPDANYICSPNVAAQMWYSGCLNQEPPGHLRCNLRWQSPLSSLPVNPTPISQLSKSKQHFVRVPTASLFTQIVLTGSAMDERGKGAIQLCNTATSSDRPCLTQLSLKPSVKVRIFINCKVSLSEHYIATSSTTHTKTRSSGYSVSGALVAALLVAVTKSHREALWVLS